MRKGRMRARWLVAVVCLGFTGPSRAWADDGEDAPALPHSTDYVEDPFSAHHTGGHAARLGTAVGFIYGERLDVLALGGTAAYGQRFGRFALEAEDAYPGFPVQGACGQELGTRRP